MAVSVFFCLLLGGMFNHTVFSYVIWPWAGKIPVDFVWKYTSAGISSEVFCKIETFAIRTLSNSALQASFTFFTALNNSQ